MKEFVSVRLDSASIIPDKKEKLRGFFYIRAKPK